MIELRVLGKLQIRGPDGRECESVLTQPKRAALLAYLLVAHRGEFARRDTIVALFWPELDQDHARAALRQATRFLRRALGDGLLVSRGVEELGVREQSVWCDAVALDDACSADDLLLATELYRGEFLEGLHVADASQELERWLDDERTRLHRRVGEASWRLVSRSEEQGQIVVAIEHARRACAMAPHDEPGVRRLIALLERTAERDAALRVYASFARRLAKDLEVEPAPETVALMARIRSAAGSESPIAATPSASRSWSTADVVPPADADAPPRPPPRDRSSSSRERPLTFPLSLVAALALLAALVSLPDRGFRTIAPSWQAFPHAAAQPEAPQRAARDLYSKARVMYQGGTLAGLKNAADYLDRATRIDSSFAPGYALLALVYVQMPMFGEVPPNDAYPRAQAAAVRGLELDSHSGDATLALAAVSAYFHWDWAEADRLFRRALTLDSANALTHIAYADYLSSTRRLAESIVEHRRAKSLDPSSPRAMNNLARRLLWANRRDEARAQLDSALAVQPGFARAHRTLGLLHIAEGRYTQAIAELSTARDLSGGRPFDMSALAQAYILAGRTGEALRILESLEARGRREYVPPYAIAAVYACLGQNDAAFAWLDRALDAHDTTMSLSILYETMLDPIRTDRRFDEVLRRMRLRPASSSRGG